MAGFVYRFVKTLPSSSSSGLRPLPLVGIFRNRPQISSTCLSVKEQLLSFRFQLPKNAMPGDSGATKRIRRTCWSSSSGV